MKKILTVLLLLLYTNIYSQVQYRYYPVNTGTTNDLLCIRKGEIFKYFVAGKNGTLLKYTSDSSWVVQQTNTNINLRGMLDVFINGGQYYVFGENGNYLISNTFGYNWSLGYCGYSNNLNGGILSNSPVSRSYIIIGDGGLILRKYVSEIDTSWHLISSGTTLNLNSIFNSGYGNVWIAGDNGFMRRSTDYGYSWYTINTGITNNLKSIYFITNDTGFAAGAGGIIIKSCNGGLNWTQKPSGTTADLNCISRLGNSLLYIVGDKVLLYSSDRGETWINDTAVPKYNFNGCSIIYNYTYGNILYIVGEGGRIYKRMLDTAFHPNANVKLDGNNISAWLNKRGTIDQNLSITNASGFEWPKGSNKFAVFTAGLCIGAFINGQIHKASASYSGEYSPGYCEHGVYKTGSIFKYYKVNRSDNAQTNWDWANWGQMVPYGAPFVDVNHNGIYEPAIDTPGVKNAVQTIFYCMTDADYGNHVSYEGFGGRTNPLGAEVHLTAWVFDTPGLQDVQFINYEIINKSDTNWSRTQIGIYGDPDLGDGLDDYAGCDTSLKLAFCYNANNNDPVYGLNPPAVGFSLLASSVNKGITPNKILGMTSCVNHLKNNHTLSLCEETPEGNAHGAYFMLSGVKDDSTSWLDPTQIPPVKTRYTYTGDPETNIGWSENKGSIWNCGHDSTGIVHFPNFPDDKRFVLSSGANDLNIAPGDTQKFVIAQMIARGTSNLNSVTELKNLTANVRNFYEINFPFVINPRPVVEIPQNFLLGQNYPNPFNAATHIKFEIPQINGSVNNSIHVTLKIYDLLGREIITLVNGEYLPNKYEVSFEGKSFASGMYFYRMTAGDFTAVKRMVLVK